MAAASSQHAVENIVCNDILEFQEVLKKSRMIDDRIIHALNTSIPTDSFAGQVSAADQCKKLYEELEQSYGSREKAIKRCISEVTTNVNSLREKRQKDTEDISVMKDLRKQQTSLRLMQTELSVEEVIKDRSLKAFYERCRQVYKPPSSSSS
ncbi:protein MIX23-like [Liolophura sinensis]|uniref:protein MIX23-like n=1 Tax=Liolophura sinensis TaxID=3198878 RepID=UPI0031587D56